MFVHKGQLETVFWLSLPFITLKMHEVYRMNQWMMNESSHLMEGAIKSLVLW